MNKISRQQPVMLGSLKEGEQFIFNSAIWRVLQQNWTKERKPDEGRARCQKVNTPVVSNLVRSNYVVKA